MRSTQCSVEVYGCRVLQLGASASTVSDHLRNRNIISVELAEYNTKFSESDVFSLASLKMRFCLDRIN